MTKLSAKFLPAFKGLWQGIVADSSIRLQYILGVMAIISCFVFGFTFMETIVVVIMITIVIALEYLNSTVENLCNLLTGEENKQIARIKDYAAAAVLVAALGALFIEVMFIIRHLFMGG